MPRFLTRARGLLKVIPIAFLACCLPGLASAEVRPAFSTVPPGPPTQHVAQASTCPNQGGILDSISVPVNMPLTLRLVIFSPAPKGGATFRLSSEDPSIVAAGDPHQSFQPEVTIPEGATVSNPFQVFGIKVGSTLLDAIPETPGFAERSTPIGAWDVNPGDDPSATKFLDANPPTLTCRALNSPDMSTDPNHLALCGQPVQGIVADGVSQLLMRMVSGLGGTACYDIVSSGPPDQGSITTAVIATQTVKKLNYGFSFYQAPDGFDSKSNDRMVKIQFTFTPNIGNGNTTKFTVPLEIVRPPLLLVHGLWADPTSWPSFWMREPKNLYITSLADYASTHSSGFATNVPKVQSAVAHAVEAARIAGYAATQADVVAHSMGGLLTRLYAASKNFLRNDNFNKGDIHRFITLDTPHGGSSFGNLLVALHNQDPVDIQNTVMGLTGGSVTQGAVCDLVENSTGLEALASPTNIPSYIVTATGGPTTSYWTGVAGSHSFEAALTSTKCVKRKTVAGFFSVCAATKPVFNQSTVDDFRFTRPNDAIIAVCDQQGGMDGTHCPDSSATGHPHITNFSTLIHFGIDKYVFIHVHGVTNTAAVKDDVLPLLDGPASGFAPAVPGLPSDGTGDPTTVIGQGAAADNAAYLAQCVNGSPPPMRENVLLTAMAHNTSRVSGNLATHANAGDSRIKITSPANGQHFAPGDTVNVTVAITPPLMANDIALTVPNVGIEPGTNYDTAASTYQVTFTIPNTAAGPLTLIPTISDTSNKTINGVPITIAVRPTTPPLSLELSQSNFILNSVGETSQIFVLGNYPSSLQRDLGSSAAGTTYKSSNTKVVTVDTEGNVKATGFGTAAVTVTNSGVQAFATFTVEDPANPLPPQNSSSSLEIIRSGFHVDRNTGFFVQIAQFTNSSPVPVIGPLYFTVPDLPSGVTLIGAGSTTNISPAGSPYFKIPLPDGVTLQPGQTLTKTLQFLNPNRVRISYTPKVFRTLAAP